MSEEARKKAHPSSGRCPSAPTLLHVCRESRAIALKRYQLIFRGKPNSTKSASEKIWIERYLGPSRIWFDFSRDTLLLHRPYGASSSITRTVPLTNLVCHASDEVQNIKNLAVALFNARGPHHRQVYGENWDLETRIKHFKSLDSLTIYDLSEGMFEPEYGPGGVTIEEMNIHLNSWLRKIKDFEMREQMIEDLNLKLQNIKDLKLRQQKIQNLLDDSLPAKSPPLLHLTTLRIPRL